MYAGTSPILCGMNAAGTGTNGRYSYNEQSELLLMEMSSLRINNSSRISALMHQSVAVSMIIMQWNRFRFLSGYTLHSQCIYDAECDSQCRLFE